MKTYWFLAALYCLISTSTFCQDYIYSNGTNWYSDFYDVITAQDPSSFARVSYVGEAFVLMWDRDVNNGSGDWITPEAYIFELSYDDDLQSQIRIRKSDFSKGQADQLADKYGFMMGQLPAFLRVGVDSINILASDALFGGNRWLNSIEITIGETSELYERTGNLEETLVHESAHAAMDYHYDEGWVTARSTDRSFISRYAFDNPNREDIAETIVPYLGLRSQDGRVREDQERIIREGIPNRIQYLNGLELNTYPFTFTTDVEEPAWAKTLRIFPNPTTDRLLQVSLPDVQVDAVELLDTSGRIVKQFNRVKSELNVEGLPAGTYALRIRVGDESVIRSQIILR